MKKKILFRSIRLSMIVVFLITGTAAFCQDSTSVSAVNGFVSFLATWPAAAKIFGVIAVISEILPFLPSSWFAGNGVLHTLYTWVTSINWGGSKKS